MTTRKKANRKRPSENENFKKICLVSSAAFSAASCIWPWTAPIGAGLGLYANIDTKDRPQLEEEFTTAVDVALSKTRDSLTTVDSQEIIDELSSDIVRPDNIDDLIAKTETYRRQYCTVLDKKRIIDTFEMYFKEEVCRCNTLSNYYLLAAGTVTIETIKSVNDALIKQDKKISAIQQGVDEINSTAKNILALLRTLLNECGFVLIAVAGCLFSALGLSVHVPLFYIHIVVCYSLSSVFTLSILGAIKAKGNDQKTTNVETPKIKRQDVAADTKAIDFSMRKDKRQTMFKSDMIINFLVRFSIYTAVSIGAYLIIVASQPLEQMEQQYETILKQLGCVAIGCVVSCWLKDLHQFWINRPK